MPLYAIEYKVMAVIDADDRIHALEIGNSIKREVLSELQPHMTYIGTIPSVSFLPDGWDDMCIPYNGDGSTRIKDLLP